jgi:hypothetical protein
MKSKKEKICKNCRYWIERSGFCNNPNVTGEVDPILEHGLVEAYCRFSPDFGCKFWRENEK